eukprot:62035-Prymnesium_polylepis.2
MLWWPMAETTPAHVDRFSAPEARLYRTGVAPRAVFSERPWAGRGHVPARARVLGDALLYVDPSQRRDSPSTVKVTEMREGDASRTRASFLPPSSTGRLLGSAARRHG